MKLEGNFFLSSFVFFFLSFFSLFRRPFLKRSPPTKSHLSRWIRIFTRNYTVPFLYSATRLLVRLLKHDKEKRVSMLVLVSTRCVSRLFDIRETDRFDRSESPRHAISTKFVIGRSLIPRCTLRRVIEPVVQMKYNAFDLSAIKTSPNEPCPSIWGIVFG